jgi:tetratricopeptide (TPR) repeat protein
MDDMSLGELDVRASVLNKAGRPDEAIVLLRHGIDKISTEKVGTEHDLCLFLIHEADVIVGMRKYHKDKEAEENYKQAMRLSEDEAIPILTRVRVMKSYGKFLANVGRADEAKYLLHKAYQSAEENGLDDQTVKIKALFVGVK